MIPEFAEQTDEMLDQGAVISLRLAHDQPSVKVPLAELTWIEEDLIIFRSLDAEDNTWEFRFGFAEESGGHALVFYARDGAVLGSLRLMEDIPEYKAQGTSARLFRARIKSDSSFSRVWRRAYNIDTRILLDHDEVDSEPDVYLSLLKPIGEQIDDLPDAT